MRGNNVYGSYRLHQSRTSQHDADCPKHEQHDHEYDCAFAVHCLASNIKNSYPMLVNSSISRQYSYVGQRLAHGQSAGLGGGRQAGQSRTQDNYDHPNQDPRQRDQER